MLKKTVLLSCFLLAFRKKIYVKRLHERLCQKIYWIFYKEKIFILTETEKDLSIFRKVFQKCIIWQDTPQYFTCNKAFL